MPQKQQFFSDFNIINQETCTILVDEDHFERGIAIKIGDKEIILRYYELKHLVDYLESLSWPYS